MLESLLFIFLIVVGGMFIVISLIILLVGLFRKSSKLKKIALEIGIVPILSFGLIAFWYLITVPSFNNSQMKDFAGTYEIHNSNELLSKNESDKNKPKLNLLADGTYKFGRIEGVSLEKNGTWKTGGIDGQFEFFDNNERLIEFASPFGGDGNEKIIFNLYDSNEVRFMKIKNE